MEAAQAFAEETRPPAHVAIIMDGNGRWARAKALPRIAGHRQGAEVVRRLVEHCGEIGVSYLTIYAFSSENWKRPEAEVDDLMGLLRHYLRRELDALAKGGVRMRFIGDRARLARDIVALIEEAERKTRNNTGLTLVVALNYGGRHEIVRAVRALVYDVRAGDLDTGAIDEAEIAARLDTVGIPDPDLMIRTSGEQRVSNFLLWQAAYTELVFLPVLWPDFTNEDFDAAIAEFHRRDRRYGASSG